MRDWFKDERNEVKFQENTLQQIPSVERLPKKQPGIPSRGNDENGNCDETSGSDEHQRKTRGQSYGGH